MRSVSRAWQLDVNGPESAGELPASIPVAGRKAGGPGSSGNTRTPESALRRSARLCAGSIDLTSADSRRSAPISAAVSRTRCAGFRKAEVGRRTIVGRRSSADTLPQIRALADIQRQRVEAIEKIDARRLGQRIERIRAEVEAAELGAFARRFAAASIASGQGRDRAPGRRSTGRARRQGRDAARTTANSCRSMTLSRLCRASSG